jgi:hypothetical protein
MQRRTSARSCWTHQQAMRQEHDRVCSRKRSKSRKVTGATDATRATFLSWCSSDATSVCRSSPSRRLPWPGPKSRRARGVSAAGVDDDTGARLRTSSRRAGPPPSPAPATDMFVATVQGRDVFVTSGQRAPLLPPGCRFEPVHGHVANGRAWRRRGRGNDLRRLRGSVEELLDVVREHGMGRAVTRVSG